MLDALQAFLKDTEETIMLSRNDVWGKVDYLADIFGKLNILNSELKNIYIYMKKDIYADLWPNYNTTKSTSEMGFQQFC